MNRFPDNAHTEEYLKDFQTLADEYAGKPITVLPYSKFRLYADTGSRIEYENDYFDRRRRLDVMFGMVMRGRQEYIPHLEDIICAICDEHTWALPAHISGDADPESEVTRIDLFASETAFALSEIRNLLKDTLSNKVCEIIKYEIMRRIINPYMTLPSKWGKNNWSAVCSAGVTASFYYLGLKCEFEKIKDSIISSLNDFLDSYTEDGCCLEGPLYWSYGFGYFVYGCDLLRKITCGAIDMFALNKVKKIAEFGTYLYLSENFTIPFSDAPHQMNYNVGLYHYLKKEYPDLVLPDIRYQAKFGDESRFRFADFYRNIVWYDENITQGNASRQSADFTDSQWFIRKNPEYSFCAKGGHNAEPHNHNDVGSFAVVRNGIFLLDDLGWPEYDGGYFNPDLRYKKYICSMSEGHSLPIINGLGQSAGRQYAAKILSLSENEITLDLSAAYEIPGLKLNRTYSLGEKNITVTDKISGCKTVTERFISRISPKILNDSVLINGAYLRSRQHIIPVLSFEKYIQRSICITGSEPLESTAYFIDFECQGDGIYSFDLII